MELQVYLITCLNVEKITGFAEINSLSHYEYVYQRTVGGKNSQSQ